MLRVQVYDVFCDEKAQGNPCAVVLLETWLSNTALQGICLELAQPVCCFIVLTDKTYFIRWFSSLGEINLCGHGSLAAGAAIIDSLNVDEVALKSNYGDIAVLKQDGFYQMSLPSWQARPYPVDSLDPQLSRSAIAAFTTRDLILVLPSEEKLRAYEPDFELIGQIEDYHALIVTAQSGDNEYVLRYFAPKIGIAEDIATGSAQCSLAPYWFDKLDANELNVRQLSKLGGYFRVEKETPKSVLISAYVKACNDKSRLMATHTNVTSSLIKRHL
ncbi:PhzF family phenazine biosynthesis protein [Alginatibacterium sediminis]|uniref:PhzF family phenazine biosynthesis protein n=1 Tax=Alginatibacterium sediminis TaxID=2164068 RepID=A0A420EHT8_9ALTE|nr:PhzF family phenazine biosynthesis protein [Alginatibacterium sediminis]RKF20282.1 PhzF family phenazine biosynthesis protein [Alginatibacterium sediminis]